MLIDGEFAVPCVRKFDNAAKRMHEYMPEVYKRVWEMVCAMCAYLGAATPLPFSLFSPNTIVA